jgi:RNase H-fold protein (predicted Holliday junction resolvase)
MTSLGISIGTTRTGVCVLKDNELLDWQVHDFQMKWSPYKLRIITNLYKQYIQKHKVTSIVVKMPPLKAHTIALTQIRKRIEVLAKAHNCTYTTITKSDIKRLSDLRNTNSLIEYARMRYPVLIHVFEKGLNNEHRYYKKLYEAVLSAHLLKEGQMTIK